MKSKVNDDEIVNIKKIIRNTSMLIILADRYKIFDFMIQHLGTGISESIDIQKYLDNIVKMRNNLAHKKLELCNIQQYIKYADDIDQLNSKMCSSDCCTMCYDKEFVSIEQWDTLRNEADSYSKFFDDLLDQLVLKKIRISRNQNK